MSIATLIARSIKSNEQLVLRELNHLNIDVCIIIESWIRDKKDDLWLKAMDLNKEPYKCYAANRDYSVRGGIMTLGKAFTRSYEYAM